jgi:hypothetical protein
VIHLILVRCCGQRLDRVFWRLPACLPAHHRHRAPSSSLWLLPLPMPCLFIHSPLPLINLRARPHVDVAISLPFFLSFFLSFLSHADVMFLMLVDSPPSTDSVSATNLHAALANLPRNVCKNRVGNRTSLALVMVIGSACLLISELYTLSPPKSCSLLNLEKLLL